VLALVLFLVCEQNGEKAEQDGVVDTVGANWRKERNEVETQVVRLKSGMKRSRKKP
jgi:hypothetical protein